MSMQHSLSPLVRSHRPLHTVLIGTSLGEESDQVVRTGLAIARRASARIHLVHAIQLEVRPVGFDIGAGPVLEQELISHYREQLQRQIERLGLGGPDLAGSSVVVGAPHRGPLTLQPLDNRRRCDPDDHPVDYTGHEEGNSGGLSANTPVGGCRGQEQVVGGAAGRSGGAYGHPQPWARPRGRAVS